VICNNTISADHNIEAGPPQGCVLGPTLYLVNTSEIPTSGRLTMSTFADGTGILSRSKFPQKASAPLADHLVAVKNGWPTGK